MPDGATSLPVDANTYKTEHFATLETEGGYIVVHCDTKIRVSSQVFPRELVVAVLVAMEKAYQFGVNTSIQKLVLLTNGLVHTLEHELCGNFSRTP